MDKKAKPEAKKNRTGKYENRIKVKGSFMDIIKASVKHAEKNSAPKKP